MPQKHEHPILSAGQFALRLIALPDSEWSACGFLPRLWSTSLREIADACRVTERAARKWWNGEARPDETKQLLLEQRFNVQRSWWREPAPQTLGELEATAWLLGTAKPDDEQREALREAFGVPIEAWDQPAGLIGPTSISNFRN